MEKERTVNAIKVVKATTILQDADELYAFWRNFENLPRIMRHLESVEILNEKQSKWQAKAIAGTHMVWSAEMIRDVRNEMISWQSLEGSQVKTAGSVHFKPAPTGRGTEVRVNLQYDPPGGTLGSYLAKLFGEEPAQQITEDLRKFKMYMETGEIATIEGQPQGA